jgi:RNA polymerase primary sigma factor
LHAADDHLGNARSPPHRITRALRALALRDIGFGSTAAPPFDLAFRCSVVASRPSLLIDAYFHAQDLFEAIMTEVKKPRRRRAAPAGIAPNEPERDILDQYLYEVSTYPLLKGTEEIELAKKIRAGDQDSLQELVKRNLRFVISVAKKYQNRGLPLIDLIGEGNVGLLTAARKFDPDQGVKFISYAVWWIRQAILSALARQGRTVRVPLNRTADLSRIIKASEILRQKLNREPSPEELSQLTGLSVDVVQSLAALNTSDVRLDAPMDPEGDRSLIERFVADEMPDTEEEAMNRFLTDEIEQALSTLPPRDAKVLRLYFGLEGGREHTLEEIGSMLGVTRERVRQLRDRALKRLREGDVGRALGSFAA